MLLVDDESTVTRMLRLMLEFEGFRVVGEADNGVDACHLARQLEPDFVILDHNMPDVDGRQTARFLRTLVPETRIVAFSAILQRRPEWADAFLHKNEIGDIARVLCECEALVPDGPDEMSVPFTYIHSVPGRLRVRMAEVKGAAPRARELQDFLQRLDGIAFTKVNASTGSVLIRYDRTRLNDHAIFSALEDFGDEEGSSNDLVETNEVASGEPRATSREGKGLTERLIETTLSSTLEHVLKGLLVALI